MIESILTTMAYDVEHINLGDKTNARRILTGHIEENYKILDKLIYVLPYDYNRAIYGVPYKSSSGYNLRGHIVESLSKVEPSLLIKKHVNITTGEIDIIGGDGFLGWWDYVNKHPKMNKFKPYIIVITPNKISPSISNLNI